MVKALLIATALVLGATAALIRPAEASAYGFCPGDDVVVNVYQSVVNDVDAGILGNAWASTSYTRNLVVVRQGGNWYCAYATMNGRFTSLAGVSPGGTDLALGGGISGTIVARWKTGTFYGKLQPSAPTRGFIGTVDFGCDASAACPGFVDWRSMFFRETFGATPSAWAYGFNTAQNGYFVRRNEPGLVGISGDITD